jgi:hypothetical protein
MSAVDIPRNTTEREQLVKVIDAAQALSNAASDPRVPQDVRNYAGIALHAAWGALGEYDLTVRP